MKRMLPLFALLLLASCDVYYIEPRYDSRDQIIGYYDVEEYSETYNDNTYYSTNISKSAHTSDEIYFSNFYGANIRVYAYLDYQQITIPFQIVDGYEIEGVGNINGSDVHLSYRVKDRVSNTRTDFCDTMLYREY
jgi:hypothetical protein